ncbi:methyltransferase type 12 [Methanosarcina sp. 2.H.T.1A.6]|uniref:methyltransferase n=1 Tax=unclassified Methanosarcina TaxID=2644672 RepID=UPI0006222F53|nr:MULTISPECIES: class I SAM-dependent methyltransferase [unclassified Methanosarcina]KKG13247.1 methyltransferase type 12 [Methanosarcina sp. 2.H.T.1A.15]KKG15422.1 methyltransferase type 12 [Methanosarcina sp. 2.H.T.1A.3]KKG24771.1 methyltransferase type 12 [Methanosarcina sp. 2.H.T.1A.6]KKG26112.1 methyltransferase type 12 [Methanosarcina sp. 2.H.T.1A.8]
MTPAKPTQNAIPHLPEDYDARISGILPYYSSFHQETINFIKSLPSSPKVWMDAGCGTGSLVNKAIEEFPNTKFLLLDPSEGMLGQAKEKLSSCPAGRLEFLRASPTQEFSPDSQELEEKPDVITAIQCHHYLSREGRAKAISVCYNLLQESGVYVTFENIRPLTEDGITIGKRYWGNFQLAHGRSEEEVERYLERFDTEYFPLTVEEHLKLLRETGFKTVELFWYSYIQAGFYCIK